MIKIEANEELFKQWEQIAKKIEAFKGIVQNTMTVESDVFFDWKVQFEEVYDELYELRDVTCGYITVDCEWID